MIRTTFVLNEVEDVETPHRSIGKEAVHRILLIIEELEKFPSASLPPALRNLASPNTNVPSPVLSISLTSLRFSIILTLPD